MKIKLFLFIFIFSFIRIKSQILPSYSITVHDTASKGYYFIVPLKHGTDLPGYSLTQSILDKNGNLVYYKKFPQGTTSDFKMHANGLMSYFWKGKFYVMDSTFTVKDSVITQNGIALDGHDFQILPNGNYALLGAENATMNLSAFKYFGDDHRLAGSATATVKCGVIQELDANKNVVFEWHSKDHYRFNDVDSVWLSSPSNVDWTHFNAVEYDNDGNYLISVRNFNEITKIKKSDGSVMWRMGGKANQFTFSNDPEMFIAQHDIRRVPNGNITLIDNGRLKPVHPATAKEYRLNETTKNASLVWFYTENNSTYSKSIGNYQKLPNGNHLINYGVMNNKYHLFNVIKTNGFKIFEIRFADTLRSYRVFNYPTLPWRLNQPTISCSLGGTTVILDAGIHASYLWNTGATTKTIAVANTGTFSVWVPKGQGGFVSSRIYTVSLSASCSSIGFNENKLVNPPDISPVFFSDKLQLALKEQVSSIEIFNATGEKIHEATSQEEKTEISTSSFPPGIYFLKTNRSLVKLVKE